MRIPPLPPGNELALPGRGTIFYRDLPGPHGAPTVVLLHGWTATADLNWFTCYEPLSRHFRVIAPDLRGHGRGIRNRKAFRMEDCADDAAELCASLGIERFIPVGYSMGGIVAQLLWQRHRAAVTGLVLSATSAGFSSSREERLSFLGLAGLGTLARAAPPRTRSWLTEQFYLRSRRDRWVPWALQEAGLHDWRLVLQAGGAIGQFSSRDWLKDIDVPTSVIITMRDHIVPVRRQMRLFEGIPNAEAYRVDGDHDACVAQADRYVPTLVRALQSIGTRSGALTV